MADSHRKELVAVRSALVTKEGRTSMGSDRDQGVAATRMTVRLPGAPRGSDQDVRWWWGRWGWR